MRAILRPLTDHIPAAAAVVLVCSGLAPVLHLLGRAMGSPSHPDQPFLDAATLPLLAKTLWIAAAVATLATILGAVLGVVLARLRIPGRRLSRVLLFGALCVSPYVLGLGWLGLDRTAPWARLMTSSELAVIGVLAGNYVPLAALLVAAGLILRPAHPEQAGLLAAGPLRTATGILLPAMRGLLAFTWLSVLLFGFSDYAVASLLQVPTYPVEIFLYYSGVFDPVAAARGCIPLLGVGAVLALGLARMLPRAFPLEAASAATSRSGWPLSRSSRVGWCLAGLGIVCATHGVPLVSIASSLTALDAASTALRSGWPAIGNSLLLTAVSTCLTIGLAWPASQWLASRGRRTVGVFVALLAFPACVPASAYGIAWVELTTLLDSRGLLDLPEVLRPAICLAARYGGLATVFLCAVRQMLSRRSIEAARIQEGWALARELRIALPFLLPSLLAVAGLVFASQLNAVEILVLTAPPGFEILALRADNLLHYGRAEDAALLALFAALLAVIPATLLLAIGRKFSRAEG